MQHVVARLNFYFAGPFCASPSYCALQKMHISTNFTDKKKVRLNKTCIHLDLLPRKLHHRFQHELDDFPFIYSTRGWESSGGIKVMAWKQGRKCLDHGGRRQSVHHWELSQNQSLWSDVQVQGLLNIYLIILIDPGRRVEESFTEPARQIVHPRKRENVAEEWMNTWGEEIRDGVWGVVWDHARRDQQHTVRWLYFCLLRTSTCIILGNPEHGSRLHKVKLLKCCRIKSMPSTNVRLSPSCLVVAWDTNALSGDLTSTPEKKALRLKIGFPKPSEIQILWSASIMCMPRAKYFTWNKM